MDLEKEDNSNICDIVAVGYHPNMVNTSDNQLFHTDIYV